MDKKVKRMIVVPCKLLPAFRINKRNSKNIVNRYRHVLALDPIIGSFLPERPAFTFHRAMSLHDKLISIEYKGGPKTPVRGLGRSNVEDAVIACLLIVRPFG